MRDIVAGALVVAFGLLPGAAFAAQGKPEYTCPPGFNLGAQTLESYLELERTSAAISDGIATVADIEAVFAFVDLNGDGAICVKLSHGAQTSSAPLVEYLYTVVDNNASVPD